MSPSWPPLRLAFDRLRQHNRLLPGDFVVVISDVVVGGSITTTSIQVRHFA